MSHNLKININKDKTLAQVSVSLTPRGLKDKKVKISTTDIRRALKKLGHKPGAVIKGCVAHNTRPSACEGSWIIELLVDELLTPPPMPATIDDGVGPVKSKPKTTRRRRTKKLTKKED